MRTARLLASLTVALALAACGGEAEAPADAGADTDTAFDLPGDADSTPDVPADSALDLTGDADTAPDLVPDSDVFALADGDEPDGGPIARSTGQLTVGSSGGESATDRYHLRVSAGPPVPVGSIATDRYRIDFGPHAVQPWD